MSTVNLCYFNVSDIKLFVDVETNFDAFLVYENCWYEFYAIKVDERNGLCIDRFNYIVVDKNNKNYDKLKNLRLGKNIDFANKFYHCMSDKFNIDLDKIVIFRCDIEYKGIRSLVFSGIKNTVDFICSVYYNILDNSDENRGAVDRFISSCSVLLNKIWGTYLINFIPNFFNRLDGVELLFKTSIYARLSNEIVNYFDKEAFKLIQNQLLRSLDFKVSKSSILVYGLCEFYKKSASLRDFLFLKFYTNADIRDDKDVLVFSLDYIENNEFESIFISDIIISMESTSSRSGANKHSTGHLEVDKNDFLSVILDSNNILMNAELLMRKGCKELLNALDFSVMLRNEYLLKIGLNKEVFYKIIFRDIVVKETSDIDNGCKFLLNSFSSGFFKVIPNFRYYFISNYIYMSGLKWFKLSDFEVEFDLDNYCVYVRRVV